MSTLPECPKCKSHNINEKTASKFYVGAIILSVIGITLLFVNWPWGILVIVGMIACLVGAVAHPNPVFHCRSCGNEWKPNEEVSIS
ncbi:MAG TPA: hypothetical protein VIU45_05440 [Chitinophagaceae bacterium]